MEQQSFFMSNTHYSNTHGMHNPPNTPVATDWQLGVPSNRASGFQQYGQSLGHTDFQGQTNLNMYSPGGQMNLPNNLY